MSAASTSLRLVNGVFMGGGAKSIAYAGALRAVRERGIWFGSVAGSSAGAIAAALIAAGLDPDDLDTAIPAGLAAARSPLATRAGKIVIGHAHSVFEGRGLRTWLETTMAQKIGKTDGTAVTFADLHRATGIELYVVAVNLADGLPVVFCRRTTPGVDVAGAVVASGAIPGAFPAGRAVFQRGEDGAEVHALIDGSAWSVYPTFVFQDRSFRAWLRGEADLVGAHEPADGADFVREDERPLLGFTLGDPEPLEHRSAVTFVPADGPEISRRFDRGPTYTSPKRSSYLVAALLASDWARLIFAIALVVWLALSIATLPIAFRRFAAWLFDTLPTWLDVLFPFLLVGALSVVVVAMMSAIALIVVALLGGRVLADTVLPSLKAVLGVPLEAPPWIGLGEDCVVIHVPREGLRTTSFDVSPEVRSAAIAAAYDGVAQQLDDPVTSHRLEALFRGEQPELAPYRRGERAEVTAPFDERASPFEVAALVVAAAAVGAVAWFAVTRAGTDTRNSMLLGIVGALVAVAAAGWYVGGRVARRASGRSTTCVGTSPLPTSRVAGITIAGGCLLLVVGAVLSWYAMDDRSGEVVNAEVVAASAVAGSDLNRYEATTDDASRPTVAFSTDRHLRLGEQVFVDTDSSTLVGAVDDPRFGLAVVAWLLAFGLITSGVRSLRWAQRCRNLSALLGERTPG